MDQYERWQTYRHERSGRSQRLQHNQPCHPKPHLRPYVHNAGDVPLSLHRSSRDDEGNYYGNIVAARGSIVTSSVLICAVTVYLETAGEPVTVTTQRLRRFSERVF